MEAENCQVTTVFTVQPSFHHRHSTNQYHEALPSSTNMQSHLTSSFADDGNPSWYSVCRVPMVEWRLDRENCRHLMVVSRHDTGPWCHQVNHRTGWPAVSVLWRSETASLICSFSLSVAARKHTLAGTSLVSQTKSSSKFTTDTIETTLSGTWCHQVNVEIGWPAVSTLWLGETASLICSFNLRVVEHTCTAAGTSPLSQIKSSCDFTDALETTKPGTWCHRVDDRTGWPTISALWQGVGTTASLVSSFNLRVVACTVV